MYMASYFDCKPLPPGGIREYFELVDKLGEGAYGKVYLAETKQAAKAVIGQDLPDKVAVKWVRVKNKQLLRDEIQLLKYLNIPRTMKYYGCLDTHKANEVFIIAELLQGLDLFDLIDMDLLTEDEKTDVLSQLATAIDDLHDVGVVHRDLKPENIMYDQSTRKLTVIDYGLSCYRTAQVGSCEGISGTPGFMDPQYMPKKAEGPIDIDKAKAADWWAFGQIAYTIFTGKQQYNYDTNKYKVLQGGDFKGIPARYMAILINLTNPEQPQHFRADTELIMRVFKRHI